MKLQDLAKVTKLTENGDLAYNEVSDDVLIQILFMSEYYGKHLDQVPQLNKSEEHKLFSMFIRDPRKGLGRRDLGRRLMESSGCSYQDILFAGRADDLWYHGQLCPELVDFVKGQIDSNNLLIKKWMPRYSSKNLMQAREWAKAFEMNKQTYGKYIKVDNTTENLLSRRRTDEIKFDQVPSLAMIKYFQRFASGSDTKLRFQNWIEDVKSGKSKVNVATSTVYDIYKNRGKIDADMIFSQFPKINISCIPIIDVSGSMMDANDSIGKAISIGHYLSTCSTYCRGWYLPFTDKPSIERLVDGDYVSQMEAIRRADWGYNTDLAAVFNLLSQMDEYPDWLVILTDMEFDRGSGVRKDLFMDNLRSKGIQTKIIWWNFNDRNTTAPERDSSGNIFLSGYNPMLLGLLEVGFDSKKFLQTLLEDYKKYLISQSK